MSNKSSNHLIASDGYKMQLAINNYMCIWDMDVHSYFFLLIYSIIMFVSNKKISKCDSSAFDFRLHYFYDNIMRL